MDLQSIVENVQMMLAQAVEAEAARDHYTAAVALKAAADELEGAWMRQARKAQALEEYSSL